MEFHYGHSGRHLERQEREYDGRINTPTPPLTQHGNIQYLDFIKMIKVLWSEAHPEVKFQAYSEANIFDPEQGYLVYSLADRVTKDSDAKPRMHHSYSDPDRPDIKLSVFRQSFINTVKFTALHQNPEVAEELIEEFENFMTMIIPILKMYGLEDIFFFRRIGDEQLTRQGKDIAARGILYRATFQKLLQVENRVLNSYYLTLQIMNGSATPSDLEFMFPE